MPQDTLPHVAEPGSKAMTETQEKRRPHINSSATAIMPV